jgi:hypothetical protein
MAVNDIYQQTVVASQGTVALANVFYTKITVDAGPPDDQDELVDAFTNIVIEAMKEFQTASIIYECILSRKVDPVTGPAKVYPLNTVGSNPLAPTPANLAITCTTRSLPWDRSSGGRYFLAGVPETWITDGRFLQSEIGKFDNFVEAVVEPFSQSGSTYKMMHHRKKFGTFAEIESAQIQPIPSRQRNRTQRLCSIS